MPPRIICPHCHSPVDPLQLDRADCAGTSCCICPECDGMIVLSRYVEPETVEQTPAVVHEDEPARIPVVEETIL